MPTPDIKYFSSLKSILQAGAVRQLIFMIGIAVSVALGIVLFMTIQQPTYQALDYHVTQQNLSSIVDTLEKANIQYKINDQDGVILVPAKDMQNARLKLAAAGIPRDDGFSYSFLNNQNDLANSQFLENARYLRALENDLAKTISAIDGISAAKVHIAIPQNNLFADENQKVTASVMIDIAPSLVSDKEKVRSIMQLIADSVPGLDPKNVSITDQYGHFLSEGLDQSSVFSAAQLNYQNKMQSYYQDRIESLIVPIVGQNNVRVSVNANIDFTQQENAQEEYDPTKTAVLSEQSDNEQDSSGGASGAPGSLSNTPPEGDSAGASGGSSSGSTSHRSSTKNYNVSKTVTYKKSNFAKVKSLSVAVVVDNEMVVDPKTKKMTSKPLSQDTINKITDLVKAAIGYDAARGDKVTVVNSEYSPVKPEPAIVEHLWDKVWFWDMAKRIIGMILGFIFLFILYKKLSNFDGFAGRSRKVAEEDAQATNYGMDKMHELKTEGISRLKQIAATEPNRVALIIKNWVGKS